MSNLNDAVLMRIADEQVDWITSGSREAGRFALLSVLMEIRDRAAAPELLAACKALFDAPHQEHFAVRLNDEEMAALNAIRRAVANAEAP